MPGRSSRRNLKNLFPAAGMPTPGAGRAVEPAVLVIFGASGDLTRRKLLPALFQLHQSGYLPERCALIGYSRTPWSEAEFRARTRAAMNENGWTAAADHPFFSALHYQSGDILDPVGFARLKEKIMALEKAQGLPGHRLFYLAVAPDFFVPVVRNLAALGLFHGRCAHSWSRVIIEKPFGRGLAEARHLNTELTGLLREEQVYRIDHYLGKETVQNLLSFRFANSIFEPLFNQRFVDHVQITVAETLGMEGRRGAYYDSAGALRDMVQNHLLQLLSLVAMEPPASLDAQSIRDEKVKVLRSLLPFANPQETALGTVRGQYAAGTQSGTAARAYRQEDGVGADSATETYVALQARIENWRWAGVPFLLRTGKRLGRRVSEIMIQFRQAPLSLFQAKHGDYCLVSERPRANRLLLRLQPDEGVSLSFACKQPGLQIRLEQVEMDFFYERVFAERVPEAYERLLLDALRGDQSLFTRSDEVEYAWRFVQSVLDGWAALPPPVFPNYAAFSEGPREQPRGVENFAFRWRPLR